MKKFLALCLTAGLAAGMLSACGQQPAPITDDTEETTVEEAVEETEATEELAEGESIEGELAEGEAVEGEEGTDLGNPEGTNGIEVAAEVSSDADGATISVDADALSAALDNATEGADTANAEADADAEVMLEVQSE